jgi:hypothetical protein
MFEQAKTVIAYNHKPTVIGKHRDTLSFTIPTQLYICAAIMLKDWHLNAIDAPEMKV